MSAAAWPENPMDRRALRYYLHEEAGAVQFELEGLLNGDAVKKLLQAWRAALLPERDRSLIVDITFVTGVDSAGEALLKQWHRLGARIVAASTESRALAEQVLGQAIPSPELSEVRVPETKRGWWLTSWFHKAADAVLLVVSLIFPNQ